MEVKTTIVENDQYLQITFVGKRKGYDEIVEGARSVYGAATTHNMNDVLMDCSELIYMDFFNCDTFNLVKLYEQELPEFSNIVISTIGNPENFEMMKFWESICLKRGYRCRVFSNEDEARVWLDSQIELG